MVVVVVAGTGPCADPGQFSGHAWLSWGLPRQSWPPNLGLGLVQVRRRLLEAEQETLGHELQGSHGDQPPGAGMGKGKERGEVRIT